MIRQTVLFGGYDLSGAADTWATNGTVAGTYNFAIPDRVSPLPGDFTVFNGEVFYSAVDASGDVGLWETNGTTAGTTEIGGIGNAGIGGANSGGLNPSNLTVLGIPVLQPAMLLFSGADAGRLNGNGLWVTNGTAAGTTELGGLGSEGISGVSQIDGLIPEQLTAFSPNAFTVEVLFQGLGANQFPGLWVTNGTAAGTSEVGGLRNLGISGAFGSGIEFSDPVVFGHEVLFNGFDASDHFGLWVTNGTAAGTTEVGGLSDSGISGASSSGINPTDLTLFNSEVVFDGTNKFGVQSLWLTDGTAADTHEIVGVGGAPAGGIFTGGFFPDFIAYNGKVLFQGEDASGNANLWVTDGTASGTQELTGISGAYTGGLFSQSVNPSFNPSFTIFNGQVLFSGTDATGNVDLWVTNGTAVGTHEVFGSLGLSPSNETAVTITVPPPDDFTGNNISDILFRDTASGDTWVEVIKVFTIAVDTSWNQIGGSDTSFNVVGTGDFYGTGTSDILFRNNSTGDTWFEAISNGAFAGWNQIGGSDTTYAVAGLGDFTGYGTSDILFRNTSTGDTWFEAISNGASAGWHQIGGSDTHYSVVGVGDFFESGVDDILFRNNSTGDTWIEAITNGASAGWDQIGGSDTHYSVAGVGDFFGNGTDDILFRNNSTGDTWFEAISNGAFAGWTQIGGSDTTYAVVGIGDYSGNNTSDILYRNSAGDTWVEQITNGAFFEWSHIGGSNTSYSVPVTVGPPALT
jgi:ELWxxDGT repeat protein